MEAGDVGTRSGHKTLAPERRLAFAHSAGDVFEMVAPTKIVVVAGTRPEY